MVDLFGDWIRLHSSARPSPLSFARAAIHEFLQEELFESKDTANLDALTMDSIACGYDPIGTSAASSECQQGWS